MKDVLARIKLRTVGGATALPWIYCSPLREGCLRLYALLQTACVISILAMAACAPQTSAQTGLSGGMIARLDAAMNESRFDDAKRIIDEAIAKEPNSTSLLMARGGILFRMGRIEESLKDFDRVVELDPPRKPFNWQRGIALYYASRFQDAIDQFESHRKVNPNDVENSVWHYLCVAKVSGLEVAKERLIPSGGDGRPPMMDVLRMFRGEITPEEVVKIAERISGNDPAKADAIFFAYLYTGLYYDALGKPDLAKKSIEQAIKQDVGGYMLDVAKVHLKRSTNEKKP